MIKTDCFACKVTAYQKFKCTALDFKNKEMNCENCKFYKTDLDSEKIEREIKLYKWREKNECVRNENKD